MTQTALCKACGLPFERVIDKGSPKQFCSKECRSFLKTKRNLANREKRRQEHGVSPMESAVNTMAHEQMK